MTEPRTPPVVVWADVSNTLETGGITGLQRVTRRLMAHRSLIASHGVALHPVVWCAGCGGFRRLTAGEEQLLVTPVPAPTRRVDRLPPWLRTPARRLADGAAARRIRAVLASRRPPSPCPAKHGALRDGVLDAGTWFVDVEAAWWDRPDRADLLDDLRSRRVRTGVLVADVLPVRHPEWFDRGNTERFPAWIEAHLRHDDVIMAISRFSLDDALALRAETVDRPVPHTAVVPMGADFVAANQGAATPSSHTANTPTASDRPFILCVSTLEPRKNHALLLDAWDRLRRDRPEVDLVLVGKQGWNTANLAERIRRHRLFGTQLRWLTTASDAELDTLYRTATVTACPSLSEGYGLSIIESLSLGTPVVASDGGAQPEAGAGIATYVPVGIDGAAQRWADALGAHFAFDGDHLGPSDTNRAERRRVATWEAPRWADTAEAFALAMRQADGGYSEGTTG